MKLGLVEKGCFLRRIQAGILECVEEMPAFDLGFLVQHALLNAAEHAFEIQHVVVGDAHVVALDWREEMEVGAVFQFRLDLARRKALVSDNDAVSDVVVLDEGRIRRCVDAVSREDFRADRRRSAPCARCRKRKARTAPCDLSRAPCTRNGKGR